MEKISKISFLFVLILLVSSCRKKDIIDNLLVSKVVKETSENIIQKSSKKGVKNLLKEFAIDEKYLKKFRLLDEIQLDNLGKELRKHKDFRNEFLKNPELVMGYRQVYDNLAFRTNGVYLKSITKQLLENPNKKPVIELLNNKNKKYAGKELNGVPFVKRVIKKDGYDIVGVFPDFSKYRLFSHTLAKEFHHSQNKQQFAIAKKALEKEYKKNPEKVKAMLRKLNKGYKDEFHGKTLKGDELLAKQIADITNPKINRVFGFTWHHNEKDGVMELVADKAHVVKKGGVAHIGGQAIWAGGVHYR